jgi:PAS domain-containing protein
VELTIDCFRKGIKGTAVPPYEADLIHKDGRRIPVELLVATLYDSEGQPAGRFGVGRDITDRRKSEEALRESEERFRTIIETARDSIFIKNRDLKYTLVNPGMERLFGMQASQLLGKTDEELFGDEAGDHIRKIDSRVLAGEIVEEEHVKPLSGI